MASTRSHQQSHEGMKLVTQDLYKALGESRWDDARVILQQRIPNGSHLLLQEAGGRSVTPYILMVCCERGMPVDVLRAILRAMTTEDYMAPLEEQRGNNILHTAILFSRIVDMARIQVFVERCPELLFIDNANGISPLVYAITADSMNAEEGTESNAADIIAMILRVYPEAIKWKRNELNILITAIFAGCSTRFLQVLLDADPNLLYAIDDCGTNVFHHVAACDRVDVLQFLLSKTDSRRNMLMMKAGEGFLPLHVAAVVAASAQVVDGLVKASPESRHVPLNSSFTCLDLLRQGPRGQQLLPEFINNDTIATLTHLGSIARTLMSSDAADPLSLHALMRHPDFSIEFAAALFAACRADLNKRDEKGDLPIHVLARQEASDMSYTCAVKVMVHLYPECCRVADANGRLPLELMADAGHSTMGENGMRVLLEAYPAAAENLVRHPRATCELLSLLGQLEDSTNALHGLLTGLPHLMIRSSPNK